MNPATEPESDPLDAWLAGDLSADERKAIEQNLAPPEEDEGDDILRDLDRGVAPHDERLTALIDLLKTQPPGDSPAPTNDAWRSILAPSDDPDLLGTLGDYEVLEVVATGGMGIVLKARDPELDREVAIKALDPELATNSTARERFLREARAAAKLEHDNILPIHGVHESGGVPYFAMRLAAGSLQDALDRGESFDTDHLGAIASGVSAALAAAHDEGIIHRDIKPANILFDETGEHVWVCDFGIARSTEDPSLTYAGAVAGTPQYMSPEQADGKELDGRSDLFALGAVLYRCATGKQAFAGNTTAAVLKNVATVEPDLGGTKLPKWFANLIGNLLAKNPRDRPADADAVLRAVGEKRSSPPKRRARRRRILLATVGTVLIAGFVALQMPATKRAINARLARDHDQVFTIVNRIGVHLSLTDAVLAARDGDTVTIPGGGPIAVDALRIPAGKSIRLKADRSGERPSITTVQAGGEGIVAAGELHLEGLDLQMKKSKAMKPMVRLDAGGSLIDCRFSNENTELPGSFYANPCAIEIRGGDLELGGCVFESTIAVPVRVRSGSPSIRFVDCSATGSYIVHVPKKATPSRIAIAATGCDFAATNFYRQDIDSAVSVDATVNSTTFATGSRLAWIAADTPDQFRWSGQSNTYPIGGAEAYFGQGTEGTGPVALAPRPPRITIEGTEGTFTDLATAIAAAPDSSTLLLAGDIQIENEIATPQGRALSFRAADESARPTVLTRHPMATALSINGPATLSGIRFARAPTGQRSMPIVAINTGGGSCLVEGCEFLSSTSDFSIQGQRGLGLGDCASATVRRCHFRVPGGSALALGSGAAETAVEDCLFFANAAIEVGARGEEPRRAIALTRCALVCGHAIASDPAQRCPPMRVDVSGCISHLLVSGFALADVREDQLADLIEWHGRENIYRSRTAFLMTFRTRAPRGFKRTVIATDAERERLMGSEKFSDEDFEFWPAPFWIDDLPLPLITPRALLDRLNTEFESPAKATLEHFAKGTRPSPPSAFTAKPFLITSFEKDQPQLIGRDVDPEFGAAAEVVHGGPDGGRTARLQLVTATEDDASKFQCALRFDIDELSDHFTTSATLTLDFLFEGNPGNSGSLLLAYYDNRSNRLHQFSLESFQSTPGEWSTAEFSIGDWGDGGRQLGQLIAADPGQKILNVFVNKSSETSGTLLFDDLRIRR